MAQQGLCMWLLQKLQPQCVRPDQDSGLGQMAQIPSSLNSPDLRVRTERPASDTEMLGRAQVASYDAARNVLMLLSGGAADREGHDAGADGRHEDLGDLEDAPAAAAQLLPGLAAELGVHALRQVARQLHVLRLILAHRHQIRLAEETRGLQHASTAKQPVA